MPRAKVPTYVGQAQGVLDVFRYPAILVGQEVVLEWDWISEAQYQELLTVHRAGGTIVWNPVSGVPGAGQYWYDPVINGVQRYWHAAIADPTQTMNNTYVPGNDLQIGEDGDEWNMEVSASGPYYVDVYPSWWPQAGVADIAYGWEYGVVKPFNPYYGRNSYVISPVDPWRTVSIYPYAPFPERCWYVVTTPWLEQVLKVGDVVYGDFGGSYRWITEVGPPAVNAGDRSWFDSILATSAQHPNYSWQDGSPLVPWITYEIASMENPDDFNRWLEIRVMPALHAVPGSPVAGGAGAYDADYSVRTTGLEGKLFDTAGYDLAFRKDVKMTLSIRGLVA